MSSITFVEAFMALGCTRHPNPVKLKDSEVTEKDGTKTFGKFCPKCYQSMPWTDEAQEKLEKTVTEYHKQKQQQEENNKRLKEMLADMKKDEDKAYDKTQAVEAVIELDDTDATGLVQPVESEVK